VAVILIVEDEAFICEVAKLIIEDMGHTTLTASDLGEALSIVRSPEPIDALFADIRLKTEALGGYELARQAIKLRPRLRVLYTSGSPVTEITKALFVEGARFVQKPYSEPQLANAVADLLAAPDTFTRATPSP
jgi:CheY-like chemotaxis protein